MRKRNLKHFLPRIRFRTERDPKLELNVTDTEMFFICDGVEIAKRGHKAQTWTILAPGWRVREDSNELELIKPH